jgi:NitT/TauT family transport system substrate-binding protein
MQALRNGLLEGAALTLDEVLTLVQDGVELRIILVMDYSLGADVLLVKPDILELDQLIGKRVAVENTAVGAIILDSALSEAGLSASDIEIVSCTHDEHLGCYSSVSAVVTFEPVTTELLKQGGRQLYDSSKMPGRIVDVLAVSPQVITAQAATLDTLLDGYFKARRYLELPPEDAAMRMAPRQGLTPEEVLASYEGMRLPDLLENHQLLEGNISPLHIRANELATFM